ncbi:MAG: radical SAM family heme chaperone HemW [Clostridia bacterium]|nr:radical SAM family heme chaperone HemW [Clostridia bacterium]
MKTGLYIHAPFCKSKCPYCDFYSLSDISLADEYTKKVIGLVAEGGRLFDTLYIGGGTPSVLGGERLQKIICAANLSENAEITVECNPSSADEKLFTALAAAGVNRISMGLQSAVEEERKSLGRLSGRERAHEAVMQCRKAGIENISLDLMLGIPGQTLASLDESLDFCLSLGVPHISAYMLKIEEGTVFYKRECAGALPLPGEDETCEMYLHTVKTLKKHGLYQYEISNFARPGMEGRHNLNYWDCGEYLGIGPAAHSFINGKRFYYESRIRDFLNGKPPVDDGTGGDFEEYVMLRLRLAEGLRENAVKERFHRSIPSEYYEKARFYASKGLVNIFDDGFALNENGFLLSNSVIGSFLT